MQITVHKGVNGPVHPAWSKMGTSEDRGFFAWTASLPRHFNGGNPWSPAFKPIDIPSWRAALPSGAPVSRYLFLFDLLESEPDLWLQLSWRS
jgi:hypothetical protein